MFHRWIIDKMEGKEGNIIVETQASKHGKVHTKDDLLKLLVIFGEMMDNSLLMGSTTAFMEKATQKLEYIQFIYGWMTSWKK
jgi:hypothetical protein